MAGNSVVRADPTRATFFKSPWYSFGQKFDNLTIYGRPAPFPVIDERAVRATAGTMLALAAIAISYAYFNKNLLPIKVISVLFASDFAIRQLTGMTPLSPFGIVGTLLVKNQRPEWVGTTQKRFAWALGLIFASTIAILTNLNLHGPWLLAMGLTFITLLWLESVVGLCVGCKIYSFLIKMNLAHPADAPACGGGACEIRPPAA